MLTQKANNEEDVVNKHAEYVQSGHEGIMVRNLDSEYKLKHRSADLQKIKSICR